MLDQREFTPYTLDGVAYAIRVNTEADYRVVKRRAQIVLLQRV